MGGAISTVSGHFVMSFTEHVYDVLAENAAAGGSGYTIVQPGDTTGLSACAVTLRCLIPVGVDWRLSSQSNEAAIMTVINRVLMLTGSDRVNILAHSQGGLIVNALVHDPNSVGKIYRVVTLGTPFLGATKALAELIYKEPCQSPYSKFGGFFSGCLVDPPVAQSLIENYPGASELLPSQDYYAAYPGAGPLFNSAAGASLDWSSAQSTVASALASLTAPASPRNMDLVNAAETFHSSEDAWAPLDPDVRLLRMVGYDAADNTPQCASAPCNAQGSVSNAAATILSVDTQPGHQIIYGTGDGTVPLFSASLYNPSASFDDTGSSSSNMYWCAVSHLGLAQSTAVWAAAALFFEGTTAFMQDSVGATCPDGSLGSISYLLPGFSAVSLTTSLSPSLVGQRVVLTASVVPADAGGTISFYDGTSSLGQPVLVASGQAELSISALTPGNHVILAVYSGTRTLYPGVAESAQFVKDFSALDVVDGYGGAHPVDSPQLQTAPPSWPGWDIARGIALRPDGQSGYVLDGWGGVHPFGGAPAVTVTGYWRGWDIARGIVLRPDGQSGYVLDGWGGVHPFGGAPAVTVTGYWRGWDIARGIVLRPDGQSGYVLDGWGGVHPFGGAPAVTVSGYWRGWDIARGIVLRPDGQSGYVLDGWGGVHPFGGAPAVTVSGYWRGWDIARGIVLDRIGVGGYVVDGFGGVHSVGQDYGVTLSPGSYFPGTDIVRGLAIA